ncbi:MAG: IS1 family transposase [Proteobacteria bacterium]|nr:IS1 family transposase [Pseudomonadota bacterium]
MANKLPTETRVQILNMLCEGVSMRGISRVTGVSTNTIDKLLVDAGLVCARFHDENVRGVKCKRVQADEIWSFVYAKQKNVAKATAAPENAGDVWTWTAIDSDSKLIISYLIGGRDAEYANEFMDDLHQRLADKVQLTTDGHSVYPDAVGGAFGRNVNYAQLVKIYGAAPTRGEQRYSPAVCLGAKKKRVIGRPNQDHISTSHVERQNLSMRMHMRRFTRLTNAHSKKFQNHCHMISLYTVWYNFVRINSAVKMSPAMACGLSPRLWEMSDIVALIDSAAATPKPRGPYKKKATALIQNSN